MHRLVLHLLRALAFFASAAFTAEAHDHIAAGVIDANSNGQADAGEPLQFVGASISGNVYHMLPEPVGNRYAGYYALDEQPRAQFPNDYFSFVVLSDGQNDVAAPNHPATGSWIWIELTSLTGPSGAVFGFWDENWSFFNTTPTRTFNTNESTGSFKFVLSEGVDAIGEDPFGHIHNRGWTVDQPGDYDVGFTLFDLGHQGSGGSPIHTPSQTYTFHFLAVPEPGSTGLLIASFAPCAMRRRRRRL